MEIGKQTSPGGALYDISLDLDKAGAAACSLATPTPYACVPDLNEGGFTMEPAFFSDHADLAIGDLLSAIGTDWTLTWDAGLPTETVATLCFGTISDSDFPAMPVIETPENGGVSDASLVAWSYEAGRPEPCAFPSDQNAELSGPDESSCEAILPLGEPEAPACVARTWAPREDCTDPTTFLPGQWSALVENRYEPGLVSAATGQISAPDGTPCPAATGDPWLIQGPTWLGLQSYELVGFTLASPVPALAGHLGNWILGGSLAAAGLGGVWARGRRPMNRKRRVEADRPAARITES